MSKAPPLQRRRTFQGEQTYQAILQAAMNVASMEGLEGLSIGRLAKELGMSKSGLFAHFGSKEELQLATIEAARSRVVHQVVRPALRGNKGLARLLTLCEAWLHYTEQRFFPGGCFFAATSVEFNSRPGAVRDRLAAILQERQRLFQRLLQESQSLGDLPPTLDTAQLAFELETLLMGANWSFQLYNDPHLVQRTRRAIHQRLQQPAQGTTQPSG